MQPWAEGPMHEQTLYKLRIIPSPWLTGSKVCSRFHLLSFWAFPLSFCSFQPLHYWPYLWVPVDLWIFLWISGSVNLTLLQLNRSVLLAPNSASLSRLQLQFPDTSLFLLVCFDLCLPSTSGSSPLAHRNRKKLKCPAIRNCLSDLRAHFPALMSSYKYCLVSVVSFVCLFVFYQSLGHVWWHTPIFATLGKLRLKNYKLKRDVATEGMKGPQQQLSKTLSPNNKWKGTGTMVQW